MASTISASETSGGKVTSPSDIISSPLTQTAFYEGGHQLEKLEFALAVSETRGDQKRSALLRSQIADLGGNIEEPGT